MAVFVSVEQGAAESVLSLKFNATSLLLLHLSGDDGVIFKRPFSNILEFFVAVVAIFSFFFVIVVFFVDGVFEKLNLFDGELHFLFLLIFGLGFPDHVEVLKGAVEGDIKFSFGLVAEIIASFAVIFIVTHYLGPEYYYKSKFMCIFKASCL